MFLVLFIGGSDFRSSDRLFDVLIISIFDDLIAFSMF